MNFAYNSNNKEKFKLNHQGGKVIEVIGNNLNTNPNSNINLTFFDNQLLNDRNAILANDLRNLENSKFYNHNNNYNMNLNMNYKKYVEDLKEIQAQKKLNDDIRINSCNKRVYKLKLFNRKSSKGNDGLTIIEGNTLNSNPDPYSDNNKSININIPEINPSTPIKYLDNIYNDKLNEFPDLKQSIRQVKNKNKIFNKTKINKMKTKEPLNYSLDNDLFKPYKYKGLRPLRKLNRVFVNNDLNLFPVNKDIQKDIEKWEEGKLFFPKCARISKIVREFNIPKNHKSSHSPKISRFQKIHYFYKINDSAKNKLSIDDNIQTIHDPAQNIFIFNKRLSLEEPLIKKDPDISKIESSNLYGGLEDEPVPLKPDMNKKIFDEALIDHAKNLKQDKSKLKTPNPSFLNSQKIKLGINNIIDIKKSKNSNINFSLDNKEPEKPCIPGKEGNEEKFNRNYEDKLDKSLLNKLQEVEENKFYRTPNEEKEKETNEISKNAQVTQNLQNLHNQKHPQSQYSGKTQNGLEKEKDIKGTKYQDKIHTNFDSNINSNSNKTKIENNNLNQTHNDIKSQIQIIENKKEEGENQELNHKIDAFKLSNKNLDKDNEEDKNKNLREIKLDFNKKVIDENIVPNKKLLPDKNKSSVEEKKKNTYANIASINVINQSPKDNPIALKEQKKPIGNLKNNNTIKNIEENKLNFNLIETAKLKIKNKISSNSIKEKEKELKAESKNLESPDFKNDTGLKTLVKPIEKQNDSSSQKTNINELIKSEFTLKLQNNIENNHLSNKIQNLKEDKSGNISQKPEEKLKDTNLELSKIEKNILNPIIKFPEEKNSLESTSKKENNSAQKNNNVDLNYSFNEKYDKKINDFKTDPILKQSNEQINNENNIIKELGKQLIINNINNGQNKIEGNELGLPKSRTIAPIGIIRNNITESNILKNNKFESIENSNNNDLPKQPEDINWGTLVQKIYGLNNSKGFLNKEENIKNGLLLKSKSGFLKLNEPEKISRIGYLRIKQRFSNRNKFNKDNISSINKSNDKLGNVSTRIYRNPNFNNIDRGNQDKNDKSLIEYNEIKEPYLINIKYSNKNELLLDNFDQELDDKNEVRSRTIDYQSIRGLGFEKEPSPRKNIIQIKKSLHPLPIDFNKEDPLLNFETNGNPEKIIEKNRNILIHKTIENNDFINKNSGIERINQQDEDNETKRDNLLNVFIIPKIKNHSNSVERMDKFNLIEKNKLENFYSKPKLIQRNLSGVDDYEFKSLYINDHKNMKAPIIDYCKGRILRNKNSNINQISGEKIFDSKEIKKNNMPINQKINDTKFILPENDTQVYNKPDLLKSDLPNKGQNKEYLFKEITSIKGTIVSNNNQQYGNNTMFPNLINSNFKNGDYPKNNNKAGVVISQKLK